MSIDLGGGDSFVTQEFLNGTMIRATVDKMSSEGVPQGMGTS